MNHKCCFQTGRTIAFSCLIATALYCASGPGAVAQNAEIDKAAGEVKKAADTLERNAIVRAVPGDEEEDLVENATDAIDLRDRTITYTAAEMRKAHETLKVLNRDPQFRYLECIVCHKRFMVDGKSASDKLRAIMACDRCEMSHVSKQKQGTRNGDTTSNQSGGGGQGKSQQTDASPFEKAKQLAKERRRSGSDTVTVDRSGLSRFEQAKQLARVKLLEKREREKQQQIANARREERLEQLRAQQMARARAQAQAQQSDGLLNAVVQMGANMAISGALNSGSSSSSASEAASSVVKSGSGAEQTVVGGKINPMSVKEKITIYRK